MVTAISVFAERFKDLGLSDATVQSKEITHKLLSFARKTDPRSDHVDLNQIVEDTISLIKQKTRYANVKIVPELDALCTRLKFARSDVDLLHEFFQGFVNHAQVTLHIDCLRGANSHHIAEAAFKAVARALRDTPNLMVVTNNLNVAQIMSAHPSAEVIVTGGKLRRSDGGLVGDRATATINQFKADIAVIGPATAKAVAAAGRVVNIQPADGFDSEHLLAEERLQDVAGRRVRIIRGSDGRELLADELKRRGASIDYLSVYERRLPEISAETAAALEARWRDRHQSQPRFSTHWR